MIGSELRAALAEALTPVSDDGFSDGVMARLEAEALLERLAPAPRSRRWALPALALTAGLIAGTVARSATGLSLPEISALGADSVYTYAMLGLTALVAWIVIDPDVLA